MSNIAAIAGQVAGIVALAAFVPYIVSILRGGTKPSKSTWWIFTLVGVMLYLSHKASGGVNTLWVPVVYILGPLVIAFLSLRFGEKGWSETDSVCVAWSLASIPIWLLTDLPLLALLINIFVDFLGIWPTLKKSYLRPWTEDRFAWGISALANLVNLFAVGEWSLSAGIYPVYMVISIGLVFVFLLNFQKRRHTT